MASVRAQRSVLGVCLLALSAACRPLTGPSSDPTVTPSALSLPVRTSKQVVYEGPQPLGAARARSEIVTTTVFSDASVDRLGRHRVTVSVFCREQGDTLVDFILDESVIVGPGFTSRDTRTVPVTCLPPEPEPASILVLPGTLHFEHVIGSTPCPQPVGTIRITNASGQTVEMSINPGGPFLTADVTGSSLAPQVSRDVNVAFTCGTQASLTQVINVSGRAGGVSDTKTVTVTGTVRR